MCKMNRLLIFVMALLPMLILGACQSVTLTMPEEPSAISVIEALEVAHNAQDVEAIVALYANDGVEINGEGTFVGLDAIRNFYSWAVKEVKVDNTHFQIEGNKVFYDCIMLVEGEPAKGAKFEAVVENGKIKSNIFVGNFPVN